MPERALYRRLHFYLGNCYRAATIPWRQRSISTSGATTIFGCSFGNDGWHHIRRTLEEYDADPDISYSRTTLYAYLKHFQPRSTCEVMGCEAECALPLFVYPWGTFRIGETDSRKDVWSSRFCGPSSESFIADEFERIKRLYAQLREVGYRPWQFGNSFIGGTFLVSRGGQRRFVVLQGNHRLAVLAHMQYPRIHVRDVPGYVPRVHENAIMKWPLVASGRCSPVVARQIFRSFFTNDGRHVSRTLSLPREQDAKLTS